LDVVDGQVLQRGGALATKLALDVGGPYAVEADGVMARDVYVGDVFVLAGQSNMEGWGILPGLEQPHPAVRVLDMARRWRLAEHPLHDMTVSPDEAHMPQTEPDREPALNWQRMMQHGGIAVGPGLAFGLDYLAHTGVPVGLIATAHAATTMEMWSPARRADGSGSLYGSMLLSIGAAGGEVAGVLWSQGESDANDLATDVYADRLRELIAAVRADVGQAALPFYVVQSSRVADPFDADRRAAWCTLREAQRRSVELGATAVVATIDLTMSDHIHLDSAAHQRLGRRLAAVVAGVSEPLDVAGVEASNEERTRWRVRCTGGRGGLRPLPPAVVAGFRVRDEAGEDVPMIFRVEVAADDPCAIDLRMLRAPAEGESLWYGYGGNPTCNVTDAHDLALPTFGPWPLT
jgi:sialate O-acetylesterase